MKYDHLILLQYPFEYLRNSITPYTEKTESIRVLDELKWRKEEIRSGKICNFRPDNDIHLSEGVFLMVERV